MCCLTFPLSAYCDSDDFTPKNEKTFVFDFDAANKNIKSLEKQIDRQKSLISTNKKELHKLQKQLSRQKKEVKNAKKVIKKAQSISVTY